MFGFIRESTHNEIVQRLNNNIQALFNDITQAEKEKLAILQQKSEVEQLLSNLREDYQSLQEKLNQYVISEEVYKNKFLEFEWEYAHLEKEQLKIDMENRDQIQQLERQLFLKNKQIQLLKTELQQQTDEFDTNKIQQQKELQVWKMEAHRFEKQYESSQLEMEEKNRDYEMQLHDWRKECDVKQEKLEETLLKSEQQIEQLKQLNNQSVVELEVLSKQYKSDIAMWKVKAQTIQKNYEEAIIQLAKQDSKIVTMKQSLADKLTQQEWKHQINEQQKENERLVNQVIEIGNQQITRRYTLQKVNLKAQRKKESEVASELYTKIEIDTKYSKSIDGLQQDMKPALTSLEKNRDELNSIEQQSPSGLKEIVVREQPKELIVKELEMETSITHENSLENITVMVSQHSEALNEKRLVEPTKQAKERSALNVKTIEKKLNEEQRKLKVHQNQLLRNSIEDIFNKAPEEIVEKKNQIPFLPRTDHYEITNGNRLAEELRSRASQIKSDHTRYQVAEFFEAGWHAYGAEGIETEKIKKNHLVEMANEPYMARIDFVNEKTGNGETIYVGNHDIMNNVISWKSDLAKIYYDRKFNETVKYGHVLASLVYIRNIDFDNGEVKKLHKPIQKVEKVNAQLVEQLAKKRGAEMKSIVSTIQKEQDEIIRLPIEKAIVLQGSAGSGKSVLALHRLSYLVYKYEELISNRVAIFGPNELFLHHIREVLPELGDEGIIQTTYIKYLEEILTLHRKVTVPPLISRSDLEALTVKEGRKEKIEKFEREIAINEVKGTLLYKSYIEAYVERIFQDVSPFLHNISYKQFCVTGIEIASFVEGQPNYGNLHKEVSGFILNSLYEQMDQQKGRNDRFIKLAEDYMDQWREENAQQLSIPRETIEQMNQLLMKVLNETNTLRRNEELLKERLYNLILGEERYQQLKEEAKEIEDIQKREQHIKDESTLYIRTLRKQVDQLLKETKALLQAILEKELKEKFDGIQSKVHFETMNEFTMHVKQIVEKEAIHYEKVELNKRLTDKIPRQYIGNLQLFLNSATVSSIKKAEIEHTKNNQSEEMQLRYLSYIEQIEKYIVEILVQQVEEAFLQDELIKEKLTKLKIRLRTRKASYVSPFEEDHLPKDEKELIEGKIKTFFHQEQDELLYMILNDKYGFKEEVSNEVGILINQLPNLKESDTLTKNDLPALYTIYEKMRPSTATKPFQYLIVDEAQDYNVYEMETIQALTENIMLIGDLGQNLNPANPLTSWRNFEQVIDKFSYYELKATYRSTKQIVEYSNEIIKPFSEGKYMLPQLAFRDGFKVETYMRSGSVIFKSIDSLLEEFSKEDEFKSIAIITKTKEDALVLLDNLSYPDISLQINNKIGNTSTIITTALDAKGLEFDCVIVYRMGKYDQSEYDSKLAYVATSRALHALYIFH